MPAAELQIIIGGITFNDFSSSNFYLARNTAELLSTLSTRQTKTEKQGEHGVHDSLSFYNERMLPFDGEIHATSQTQRKTMENALKAALGLPTIQSYAGDDGYILVQFTDEDGQAMQCYAKVLDPPRFEVIDNTDPARRRFSFVMMAADPILYSQTLEEEEGDETVQGTNFMVVQGESPTVPFQLYQQTAVSATCTNGGTFGAPPIITIDGPTTGPRVTNVTTGLVLDLDGLTLAEGESVVIDVGAKTILKNDGTDLSGYLTAESDWWVLEPGDNELTLLDDTPAALEADMTIQWRDSWI